MSFVYEKFDWKEQNGSLVMNFFYSISPDLTFTHKVTVPSFDLPSSASTYLDNLVFHLGLIEMFSYWKLTASAQITIKAGFLDEKQTAWWKKLLIKGMGEFFYKNNIDPKKVSEEIRFSFSDGADGGVPRQRAAYIFGRTRAGRKAAAESEKGKEYLLLFGGGKDSLVAYEILKKAGKTIVPLWINPLPNKAEILKSTGLKEFIEVKRQLDPLLLTLNKKDFLNGHVPFSASLAFISLIVAALFKTKYITVANEKSADEENIEYLGSKINHQYSKSFEFESDFNEYIQQYLAPDILYFSLLRPLYELQIAQAFSKFPKYLQAFKSCNLYPKLGYWCGHCPKCLSVYLLLSPFLGIEKTTAIFGKNLFEDKSLLPLFKQLTGDRQPKPFECVATYAETKVAAYLCSKALLEKGRPLPYLLDNFWQPLPQPNSYPELAKKILSNFSKKNFIPANLEGTVKQILNL